MSRDFRDLLVEILENAWAYGIPVLICLGTIGNCLCVLVPFRTEMKNMVSLYYFIALAISNEVFIINLLLEWIFNILEYQWFYIGFCKLIAYIPMVSQFLSIYFIISFIVERFNAVRVPQCRQAICTLGNAKIIIAGLTFLGLALPSVVFWTRDSYCRINKNWQVWLPRISLTNAIIIGIVPSIVITVLSTRIVMSIRAIVAPGRSLTHPTTNGSSCTDEVSAGQQNSSLTTVKQTKITKMLLIVAIVSMCLNLLANLMDPFFAIEYDGMLLLLRIFHIVTFLSFTRFGLIFFLCCAINQDFRQAALATILCRPRIYSTVPQTIPYSRGTLIGNAPTLTTSSGDCMMPQGTTLLEMYPEANPELRDCSNVQNSQKLQCYFV